MASVVAELLQPPASIGTYRLDRTYVVDELDEVAARILGRPVPELRGRCLWDVFPGLRGSSLHRRYAEILEGGGGQRFLFHHRPADRWYAVAALPLGQPGHPSGLEVRFGDATEELSDLRAGIEAERLDAAAQAVGRLAHDMNNCLTVTLGNAEYLEEELGGQPELLAAVRLILQAADRGAALTGRVLRFARRIRRGAGEVELPALLAALATRLEAEAPAWRLTLACDPGLPAVLADAAELEDAVEELVANARAAMPGGGGIGVSTSLVAGAEAVAVVVEDRGRGMASSLLRRCAEPFATDGAGLGLGLSAVHGFAAAHGGSLRLQNRAGGGIRAVLELPAASPPAEEGRGSTAAAPPSSPILLVEDDPAGRAGVSRMLGALGYGVTAAASATEALAMLRNGPAPAAILADVVLPGGPDGARLVEEARRLRPGLPAILMSGYAARLPGDDGGMTGGVPLLAKPFRKLELAQALEGVLRRTGAPGPAAPATLQAEAVG